MLPVWLGVALLIGCHPRPATPAAAAPAPALHVDRAPPDATAWYLEGVAAEVRGDFDRARRAYGWVARLDRGSPWPQLALGRLAALEGDPEAARAAFDAATTAFLGSYAAAGPPLASVPALREAAAGAGRTPEVTAWLEARGVPPEPPGAP